MIDWIKRDTLARGLIVGIIAPFFGFYFYKLSFFSYWNMQEFFQHLVDIGKLSAVISLSIIINAAVFFLFLHKDWELTARGVLLATFLYGIIIIYLKFF
jgi:hypothetical protein